LYQLENIKRRQGEDNQVSSMPFILPEIVRLKYLGIVMPKKTSLAEFQV
jgi:hypothetical protein